MARGARERDSSSSLGLSITPGPSVSLCQQSSPCTWCHPRVAFVLPSLMLLGGVELIGIPTCAPLSQLAGPTIGTPCLLCASVSPPDTQPQPQASLLALPRIGQTLYAASLVTVVHQRTRRNIPVLPE